MRQAGRLQLCPPLLVDRGVQAAVPRALRVLHLLLGRLLLVGRHPLLGRLLRHLQPATWRGPCRGRRQAVHRVDVGVAFWNGQVRRRCRHSVRGQPRPKQCQAKQYDQGEKEPPTTSDDKQKTHERKGWETTKPQVEGNKHYSTLQSKKAKEVNKKQIPSRMKNKTRRKKKREEKASMPLKREIVN